MHMEGPGCGEDKTRQRCCRPWLEGQGARSGAGVLLVVSVFVCVGGGGVWVGRGPPLCRALLR